MAERCKCAWKFPKEFYCLSEKGVMKIRDQVTRGESPSVDTKNGDLVDGIKGLIIVCPSCGDTLILGNLSTVIESTSPTQVH